MNRKESYVVPAVPAAAGAFSVVESKDMESGACAMPRDGHDGLLEVPFDDSPSSRAVRIHEYGHLAIQSQGICDQKKMLGIAARLGVRRLWIEVVHDVIVNSYVYSKGCHEITSIPLPDEESLNETSAPLEAVAMDYIRVLGLQEMLGSTIYWHPNRMGNQLYYDLLKASNVLVKLGYKIAKKCRIPIEEELARHALSLQSLFDQDQEEDKKESPREKRSKEIKNQMVRNTVTYVPKVVKPGVMEIIQVPLTVNHRSRMGRKYTPNFSGSFRYPHRAFIPMSDGKAFSTKKRLPGGTLLLDCSGSMNLNDKDIEKLMDKAPHLTVAMYAGDSTNEKYSGKLVVVAEKGKKARSAADINIDVLGGLNIIDVPALEWLNKQSAPRMWVSDGGVTGEGHVFAINISQECLRLVEEGKVEVQESIGDFLKT